MVHVLDLRHLNAILLIGLAHTVDIAQRRLIAFVATLRLIG
jgi:hypothetical protein